MPTLVVHIGQLQDARDLLREIRVQAELVAYEGRESTPRPQDLPRIQGVEVAFVGVRKDYKRAAARLGGITQLDLATVRGGRIALTEWLRPKAPSAGPILTPRAAFEAGASAQRRLLLADGALDSADRLVTPLHPFVNRAVTALCDLVAANARAPEGLVRFFGERDVTFAPSGGRAFRYRIIDGQGDEILRLTPLQHKHLKDGDRKNTPEECARIYFGIFEESVVVARCGPHPAVDFEVVVRRL